MYVIQARHPLDPLNSRHAVNVPLAQPQHMTAAAQGQTTTVLSLKASTVDSAHTLQLWAARTPPSMLLCLCMPASGSRQSHSTLCMLCQARRTHLLTSSKAICYCPFCSHSTYAVPTTYLRVKLSGADV